jgi:hypothetical protein
VINDYEKSVIGTFTRELLERLNTDEHCKDQYELYFTITKFENDIGFSLIHQEPEAESERDRDGDEVQVEHNDDVAMQKMEDYQKNKESLTIDDPADAINSNLNLNSQSFETHGLVPQTQQVQKSGSPARSPVRAKEKHMRDQRKAMLTRHGVIPEYIKISEIYQVYTAFTQANLKNSILH